MLERKQLCWVPHAALGGVWAASYYSGPLCIFFVDSQRPTPLHLPISSSYLLLLEVYHKCLLIAVFSLKQKNLPKRLKFSASGLTQVAYCIVGSIYLYSGVYTWYTTTRWKRQRIIQLHNCEDSSSVRCTYTRYILHIYISSQADDDNNTTGWVRTVALSAAYDNGIAALLLLPLSIAAGHTATAQHCCCADCVVHTQPTRADSVVLVVLIVSF